MTAALLVSRPKYSQAVRRPLDARQDLAEAEQLAADVACTPTGSAETDGFEATDVWPVQLRVFEKTHPAVRVKCANRSVGATSTGVAKAIRWAKATPPRGERG